MYLNRLLYYRGISWAMLYASGMLTAEKGREITNMSFERLIALSLEGP